MVIKELLDAPSPQLGCWLGHGCKTHGQPQESQVAQCLKCVQPLHPLRHIGCTHVRHFLLAVLEEINVDASKPRLAVAPPQMEKQSLKCDKT